MPGDLEQEQVWTHPSVAALTSGTDPLRSISALVDALLLSAADEGALGSPTDPFQLAALMGVGLRPRFDVADARLVSGAAPAGEAPSRSEVPLARFVGPSSPLVIEYNPTRPRGRLRYNVAHELAHAFFPDAAEQERHRTATGAVRDLAVDDSWQLELLCNVAAAEILMPSAAIEGLVNSVTDIDFLMEQRSRFHVSTEALFRRLVHATDRPIALAAFNRVGDDAESGLRCDYVLSSRTWNGEVKRGVRVSLTDFGVIPGAVGQTTRGTANLGGAQWMAQSVGIPPYPGRNLPRVLALLEPPDALTDDKVGLIRRTGDIATAVDRELPGPDVVVAHVVSNRAHAWGKYGVAKTLRRIVPDAAAAFRSWSIARADNLELGNIHAIRVEAISGVEVTVVSLVAQAGYGPSAEPRLSYVALSEALDKLAAVAAGPESAATVHMPRIGAGEGGGRWDLIEAAIERSLLDRGVPVVVYTLPSEQADVRGKGRA